MSVIHITTPEQFVQVFNSSSAIGSSSDYAEIYLDNDIDFEGYLEEQSITHWRSSVDGGLTDYYYFDGQGYSIKNLVIFQGDERFQFMCTNVNGYIRNLVFDNCHFTNAYTGGNWCQLLAWKCLSGNTPTDTNPCIENIIVKGNCSYTNARGISGSNIFAIAMIDDRVNAPQKRLVNRLGISGTYRARFVYGCHSNNYFNGINIYMNSEIHCYEGALFRPQNNYSGMAVTNAWNRSKVEATNYYGGITGWQSNTQLLYCYTDMTNIGGTPTNGICPIANNPSAANMFECLYYADYTIGDGRGVPVTRENLKDASFLRQRGWLI